MATHSCILVWRILWTGEPGRLQSMGSQRVGQNGEANTSNFTFQCKIGHSDIGCFWFLFGLLFTFIGVYLLYCVVLVLRQNGSAIPTHRPLLFWIPFPFRSPQSTEFPALRSRFSSSLYIISIVYICQSQPPDSSRPSPFPLWYT